MRDGGVVMGELCVRNLLALVVVVEISRERNRRA